MKLAVYNDWYDKKSAVFFNKDGFLKALQVLRDRDGWEVTFFKKHEETFSFDHDCVKLQFQPDVKQAILDWKPDATLHFGDFSRPILGEMKETGLPMAMCLTGGLFDTHIDVPQIVFVESTSYLDWLKSRGVNAVRAFGTNTEVFKPLPQPKIWDACFPATFAAWKRHDLFAEAMGSRGVACGWWQPHEPQTVEVCQKYGVTLLHHQNAESTNLIYNASRTCLVTSDSSGGSQRTILEAMACNIPVIVNARSEKCSEFIGECGVGAIEEPSIERFRQAVDEWKDREVNTRDFIISNYSEYIYADKLKEGISSIL